MFVMLNITTSESYETKTSSLVGFFEENPTLTLPEGKEISGNSLPFGESRGGVLLIHIQYTAKL